MEIETRYVTHARRTTKGNISSIANPVDAWYERTLDQAIADIESGYFRYIIDVGEAPESQIYVVNKRTGKYLRSAADSTSANNLDDLNTNVLPTFSMIRAFAPQLRLHPNEEYMPMDAMDFIQASRFRHHKAGREDEGYNKVTEQWITGDDQGREFYDIPLGIINSYRASEDGSNRRPRDSNNGPEFNVFLQPNGKPVGNHSPSGEVPCYYYVRDMGINDDGLSVAWIQYWFFFGYNDGYGGYNHQGDWEHVTVVLRSNQIAGAYFAAHGEPTYYPHVTIDFEDGHIVAYSAKGSHASYPEVGSFHTLDVDKTKDGGYEWRTWLNIVPLEEQPWRYFAGAWGEVGQLSSTTGPLGPWYKRFADG